MGSHCITELEQDEDVREGCNLACEVGTLELVLSVIDLVFDLTNAKG